MSSMWQSKFTLAARALTLAVGVVALAACGGKGTVRPDAPTASDNAPSSRGTPEERVKQRAVKRWEMLIDKRYDEAYSFLSPGYREVRPREDYVKIMQGRPVQWTRVHHKDSKCDGESCIVNIEVHAQFEMPVMRVGTVDTLTVLKENWILSEGEWYLVPSADR